MSPILISPVTSYDQHRNWRNNIFADSTSQSYSLNLPSFSALWRTYHRIFVTCTLSMPSQVTLRKYNLSAVCFYSSSCCGKYSVQPLIFRAAMQHTSLPHGAIDCTSEGWASIKAIPPHIRVAYSPPPPVDHRVSGFHHSARFSAIAICPGVIDSATNFRFRAASLLPFSAANLNHLYASTLSCCTPSPRAY